MKEERASFSRLTLYTNIPPMGFDHPMDDGQAESGPFTLSLRREEGVENMVQIFSANPAAGILDFNLNLPFRTVQSQDGTQVSSVRHGLDGIENEIQKTLL